MAGAYQQTYLPPSAPAPEPGGGLAPKPTDSRGRIAAVLPFMPALATQELKIATIDAASWRSGMDLAIDPKGNTNLANALVRVYANVGTTHFEVARGRVANPVSMAKEVVRLRGQGAESYDVTFTLEANVSNLVPNGQPLVSYVLFGEEVAEAASDPITVFQRFNPNNSGALIMTHLPTQLFSLATGGGNNAADCWVMVFDATAVPSTGATPALPPLYVPAGGKGDSSYDFAKRPFPLLNGLVVGTSSTPGTWTATATSDSPEIIAEYV